jgi:exonuclease SbcD
VATSYFLHAADLHLGAQLKSLGSRVSTELAERIRNEVRQVFDDLVKLAIDRRVEFIVLAGDVYDHAENDPGAKQRVYRGFKKLEEAGIPVFVVHGNHDPLGKSMAAVADRPTNVHVFDQGVVGTHTVTLRNGVDVTVAGISFGSASEEDNLALKFKDISGTTVVGVLHTNVGGIGSAGGHGNYAPCSQQDLMNAPVNYWALGHIHDRQVHTTPKGYWAYPGNLQGRSTKATECGPKGVLIVGIDSHGAVEEPEFVAIDRVRFHRLSVNLGGCETSVQVLDRVDKVVQEYVETHADVTNLFRIELVGRTDAYDELQAQEGQLLDNVRDHVSGSVENGAVLKVVNSAQLNVDPAELRQRMNLLGNALRSLDAHGAKDELSADLLSDAERILIDALEAK